MDKTAQHDHPDCVEHKIECVDPSEQLLGDVELIFQLAFGEGPPLPEGVEASVSQKGDHKGDDFVDHCSHYL